MTAGIEGRRAQQMQQLDGATVDVLIIGGGINGAVSAAALAGHDVSVAVVDRGDFAGFTSQESSNLIWGGFKYLQTYEFGLVRKLSQARNRLLDAYPSSVTPINFLAVFDDQAPFPPWLVTIGSFAYWAIGNFETKGPRPLKNAAIKELEPAINTSRVKGGLLYADAYLEDNDARFVFGFVRRAVDSGAIAANYAEVTSVEFNTDADHPWTAEITDRTTSQRYTMQARAIVNATGPFLDEMNRSLDVRTKHRIAHSKGIHLVVPQIGTGERVFAFFDEDERLYYVIPMDGRSVIGTTDTRVDSPFTEVTSQDRAFVLRQVNARLDLPTPIAESDIISERCGVRPLVVEAGGANDDQADWLQLSRRHEIEASHERKVLSIFGGKLTDCLNVGEEIVELIGDFGIRPKPLHEDWFGEPSAAARAEFLRTANAAGIGRSLPGDASILWRRYGTKAAEVLERIVAEPDLVWDGPPYHRGELAYIGEHELVVHLDDFLRRRSGLSLTETPDALAESRAEMARILGVKV